jgi:hypothetical protein
MTVRAGIAPRFTRFLLLLLGNACVLLALLVFVEGFSSLAMFARRARWYGEVAERQHTRYDSELGWVSIPNVRIPNLYREGAHLTTNARGFRGKTEVADAVPAGKVRVVCSGDSFTLGFGVDDDETWCQVLTRLDPSLETVNMGQGGYGADQVYLWYRRDGLKIDHDIQVFAFITDDFRRMRHDQFLGYAKPWISVDGKVQNVPVPPASYSLMSWWVRNLPTLDGLRSVEVLQGVAERLGLRRRSRRTNGEVMTAADSRTVLRWMLEELDRLHRSRGTRLVLMHLPTRYELRGGQPLEWFDFFRENGARLGLTYLNLFEPFGARGQQAWAELFLAAGEVKHPSAAGHLTAAGNRLVAELLLNALTR